MSTYGFLASIDANCSFRNVGEKLIEAGLATVRRTRADDESRTFCYDDLLAAEANAKKENRGIHGKDLKPMRVLELTGVSKSLFIVIFYS